jgi:hydroxypyruvate isomerase
MPRFAANLSMMYQEYAFLDRFAAAAADGFRAVEFLFPYEYPAAEIAARLQAHGLTQALFNLPPGDWAAGERGMASLPGRKSEFVASIDRALEYALATGCKSVHAMAGLVSPGADLARMCRHYVANQRLAAERLAPHGITLLIEPINTRDMPAYFLNFQQQAHDIVAEVRAPNLKVQMDFYHCQIMEGDLLKRFERFQTGVGHIQIAGVPARHEPDTGEVDYAWLLREVDARGYDGYIGCEYRPRAGTSTGLDWFQTFKDFQ